MSTPETIPGRARIRHAWEYAPTDLGAWCDAAGCFRRECGVCLSHTLWAPYLEDPAVGDPVVEARRAAQGRLVPLLALLWHRFHHGLLLLDDEQALLHNAEPLFYRLLEEERTKRGLPPRDDEHDAGPDTEQ